MHRFRIAELGKDAFWLRGSEREHLVRVLRLKAGDGVVAFDNTGAEYSGVVMKIEEHSVTCRICHIEQPEVEAGTTVYLVVGLAKGEKMDWVIQKGTELGMAGFVPLRAKRSVVQLEGSKAQDRVGRWQRIASEAAKQCERVREPEILPVCAWRDLAAQLPGDTQWLIPYEEEEIEHLASTLEGVDSERPIAVLIGPEGGFEPAEVALAKEMFGARSVTLGPRVLKTETAALAALILVLAHFGDLG